MTALQDLFTCQLPDHWTPEQALAVHEALEALLAAVWAHYGTQMQPLLAAEQLSDSPQLDLFDFDDALPF
jgi:small basic protein